jgi:hypothetical protein
LVGFFNSISYFKDELAQYSRLKDICIQKVKILQENGGIYSPMTIFPKYYGRKSTLGEILLYNDIASLLPEL